MKKNCVLSVLALFVMLHVAGIQSLSAQSGATLSVQGVIKNSDGSAVEDGNYSIKFSLYASESGGTPVWTETQDAVDVTGGIYSVLLGASSPLTAAFDRTYYMGMSIDGGAELIPRARLTSSPYALSLIGQSNTFPSAGTVGVGISSPDATSNLHVHGSAGNARVLVSSATADDNAAIELKSGNNFGSIAVEGGTGNLNLTGTNDIYINSKGALRAYTDAGNFVVNDELQIRKDQTSASALKLVSGSNTTQFKIDNAGTVFLGGGGDMYIEPGGACLLRGYGPVRAQTDGFGFYVNGRLEITQYAQAVSFNATSDARVKKDFRKSIGSDDLTSLMKIEVTDYRYIDQALNHAEMPVKGLIAQQVETIYPQAVTKSNGFLPNILENAVSVAYHDKDVAIQLAKPHDLVAGDRVRLQYDGNHSDLTVVQVQNNHNFTLEGWDSESRPGNIFVYGKEISDFRTVDYDRIFTMNVSATQELARQLDALKAENALLKSDNAALKSANHQLEASVDKIDARLRSLENKLSN
jgi:hypothetical protein